MTIEAWNIVLSSIVLGLVSGGGFWLKYVVDQQLKSKDTTIEALKGVVELKDAQISTLSGNTAPAIAQAYAAMKNHADQMTSEQIRLSQELDSLTVQLQRKELATPMRDLVSQTVGIMAAQRILHYTLGSFLFPDPPTPPAPTAESMTKIINSYSEAFERMNEEVADRNRTVDAFLTSVANKP
ncbi:MAG: hypothetical protein ACM3WP_25770 [Acidobacteriota bacterium]